MRRFASIILSQGEGADLQILWARRPVSPPQHMGFFAFPGTQLQEEDPLHTAAYTLFRTTGLLAIANQGIVSPNTDTVWHVRREAVLGGEQIEDLLSTQHLDTSRYQHIAQLSAPPWAEPSHTDVYRLHLTPDEVAKHAQDLTIKEWTQSCWVHPSKALHAFHNARITCSASTRAVLEHLDTSQGDLLTYQYEDPIHAHEVAGGWFVIPLSSPTLAPATHTNCILAGDRSFVVIDPGTEKPGELARLFSVIDARIARGDLLKAICLTHHHVDHICGVPALLKRYGRVIPVWAHAETAAAMGRSIRVTQKLHDGQVLRLGEVSLECVWTPGHAPGHLMFWERQSGICAGGDLVASQGTILVCPPEGSMHDYLASLQRAQNLDIHALYPSHGEVLLQPQSVFAHYIRHRQAREEKVLEALRNHHGAEVTALELVSTVYADVPSSVWPIATLSLQAHLEHLVVRGLARQNGVSFGSLES